MTDTSISGYHAPPYDPPQPGCPHCHQDSHECRCLPGLPDYGYDDDLQERIDSGELDELALQQVYRDLHALQPGFWELTARAVNHG